MQTYIKTVTSQFHIFNIANIDSFVVQGSGKVWGVIANAGERFSSVTTVGSQKDAERAALDLARMTGMDDPGRSGTLLIEWTGSGFSSREL